MIKPVFQYVNLSENIQQQVVNLKDPHFPASTLSPPVIDFDKEDSLLKENVIFVLDALVYSKSSTIYSNIFWKWEFILTILFLFSEEPKLWFPQCWAQSISVKMNVIRLVVGFCLCSILRFWLIFFGTYGYLRDVKFALFSHSVFSEHVIPVPYTDAYHLAIFI